MLNIEITDWIFSPSSYEDEDGTTHEIPNCYSVKVYNNETRQCQILRIPKDNVNLDVTGLSDLIHGLYQMFEVLTDKK